MYVKLMKVFFLFGFLFFFLCRTKKENLSHNRIAFSHIVHRTHSLLVQICESDFEEQFKKSLNAYCIKLDALHMEMHFVVGSITKTVSDEKIACTFEIATESSIAFALTG